MADTKRQSIVAAMLVAFAEVKIEDGYETDLGNNVSRWRIADYDLAKMSGPGLSLYDYEEKIDTGANLDRAHFRFFKVEAEVKLAQVADGPKEILQAFADIEKVVGANQNWGGLAVKTVPGGNKITVEQGTKKIAGGIIAFEIHFITQPFNAYE